VRTTVCRCELDEALAARGVGDSDMLYLEAEAGSVVAVVALPADCVGMVVCDSYLGALLQLLCIHTNELEASNEGRRPFVQYMCWPRCLPGLSRDAWEEP